jgi:hypothetical protein
MTTITMAQTQTTATARLAIKKKHLAGLDPEWVELWHTHGAKMVRADEISLEEYRKNPALYSFTYPTCAGPSIKRLAPLARNIHTAQVPTSSTLKTNKFQSQRRLEK